MVCHNCGREIKLITKVGRKDECPHCDADMHCCKNCRHFDPGKSNQCIESQAEYLRDKLRANFCEYFSPNTRVPLTSRGNTKRLTANTPQDDVRKAFDALFKKK